MEAKRLFVKKENTKRERERERNRKKLILHTSTSITNDDIAIIKHSSFLSLSYIAVGALVGLRFKVIVACMLLP